MEKYKICRETVRENMKINKMVSSTKDSGKMINFMVKDYWEFKINGNTKVSFKTASNKVKALLDIKNHKTFFKVIFWITKKMDMEKCPGK